MLKVTLLEYNIMLKITFIRARISDLTTSLVHIANFFLENFPFATSEKDPFYLCSKSPSMNVFSCQIEFDSK